MSTNEARRSCLVSSRFRRGATSAIIRLVTFRGREPGKSTRYVRCRWTTLLRVSPFRPLRNEGLSLRGKPLRASPITVHRLDSADPLPAQTEAVKTLPRWVVTRPGVSESMYLASCILKPLFPARVLGGAESEPNGRTHMMLPRVCLIRFSNSSRFRPRYSWSSSKSSTRCFGAQNWDSCRSCACKASYPW